VLASVSSVSEPKPAFVSFELGPASVSLSVEEPFASLSASGSVTDSPEPARTPAPVSSAPEVSASTSVGSPIEVSSVRVLAPESPELAPKWTLLSVEPFSSAVSVTRSIETAGTSAPFWAAALGWALLSAPASELAMMTVRGCISSG